jgi:O-antigen ligase
MVIGLLLTLRAWQARVLVGALGVLIVIPFMYTLSRSSWIALVPMYMAFLIFSNRKAWLIISAALVIAVSPVFIPQQVVDRVVSTFEEEKWHGTTEKIGGVSFDPSTSERITRYKDSLGRWMKHPILGYGVTGGGFIDGQFLRTLEETGFLGLVAILWVLFSIFRTAHRNYYSLPAPFFRGLSLGLMAGVAALLGHAVGSSTFIIVRIMEPFWLMVAIVVRSPDLVEQEFGAMKPEGTPAALKERLSDERPIEEGVLN